MNNKQKGILFSILTSLSLGITTVIVKLAVNLINPETMNVLWFMFSSVLFVLLFVFFKKTKYFKTIIRNWRKIALISLFVTAGSILFTYGISYAGPTNAAFIIQFTMVFSILFGIIFLKEKSTKLEGLGFLITIIGAFILTYGNIEMSTFSILILLAGSLCFALSNLFSKIYVKNINPITLAGGRSMLIFLFLLVYSLSVGRLQLNVPSIAFGYIFLGSIGGAFLGFILFYKALEVFEMSKSMAIRSIEPFLTAIYAFIILSLIPTLNQLLGGGLIVIGIIILSLTKGSD